LEGLKIDFQELAKPAMVLKSFALVHARDPECYYLKDEKSWVKNEGTNE
jgi:hypothetical protein